MKKIELAELTDEELLQEAKKFKSTSTIDAVIIGLLVGVSLYSINKNGFGLLTFLPFIYIPLAVRNKAKHKELDKLLRERNLK